ncbi:MAG: HAMP domain-containing histidine kinase [Paludibacteraceae bacterium]|nr:HAMP domain-containing histidine kinase [Paludibacteraceae bacterium]
MQWADRIKRVKIALVMMAVFIAIASLVVSHKLVGDLSNEEKTNMKVWAEAMRSLNNADENTDLGLVLTVINGNEAIPVIVISDDNHISAFRNIDLSKAKSQADSTSMLQHLARSYRNAGKSITIGEAGTEQMEVLYDDSIMLKRLESYPYVQLGVVFIFVVVAIFALLSSKRAEQNKVWVGLSKETAHQLGTPISSLMAWMEILRESHPDDEFLPEMDKDVKRLELIAERFSKIGSLPTQKPESLTAVIANVIEYIGRRTSNKVRITTEMPDDVIVSMNAPLFEWVIETLCKNAVDAMNGEGHINIKVIPAESSVAIEVSDTGKGITKRHFSSVFAPGFTTKQRGWGLGLSLAKRIVEEYHKGKIFVKSSEIGKGTTFRIELKNQ